MPANTFGLFEAIQHILKMTPWGIMISVICKQFDISFSFYPAVVFDNFVQFVFRLSFILSVVISVVLFVVWLYVCSSGKVSLSQRTGV